MSEKSNILKKCGKCGQTFQCQGQLAASRQSRHFSGKCVPEKYCGKGNHELASVASAASEIQTGHCWCENFELSKTTLEEYRKLYRDCLCMECLDPSYGGNQGR